MRVCVSTLHCSAMDREMHNVVCIACVRIHLLVNRIVALCNIRAHLSAAIG